MATTMLAWQKHLGSTNPVREEVPVPKTPSNGFLVKIHAAGVCHSDYALLQTETKPFDNWADKYTLGHEGCGEIVEIGPEVKDSRFKKGTLIAILAVPGCGSKSCTECGPGNPQLCKNELCNGIGSDGSFAAYVAVPYRGAVLVPQGVTAPQAAVATDACMTAYHAVKGTGKIQSGETVVIFGLGGLGFNALQIVLALGARAIVVDKRSQVLEEALKFGVAREDAVPLDQDVVEFIQQKNIVVDVVLDFVGVNDTFTASQKIARAGGRLVQVGLLAPELTLNNIIAVRKQLSILCSYGGTMEDVEACLDMISKGTLKPQVEETGMDRFPEVLNDLHAGKIKSRIALIPTDI